MNSWNGLDFFIFLIFALNTILGMQRGASKEIISMMCLSAALIFTIKFTVPIAAFFNSSPLISDVVDNPLSQNFMIAIGAGPLTTDMLMELNYTISMLICFVGVFSICEAGLNVAGVNESFTFPYATLSRKIGAGLGATRGYIITIVFLSLLMLHLLKNNIGGQIISGSYFANLFRPAAVQLDAMITARTPEAYNQLFKDKGLFDEKAVIEHLKGSLQNKDGALLPADGSLTPDGGNGQPATPATPAKPAKPAAPPAHSIWGNPATPATPESPAAPQEHSIWGTPATPATPAQPANQGQGQGNQQNQ